MTATTDRTSEVTAESIANNLSFVRGEIADTAAKIDEPQVADLARHLCRHTRVFVAGAGRSGLVLRMFAMRLMHFGPTVHVAGDTTTPAISSGDLLLVASGSGTTSGVVNSRRETVFGATTRSRKRLQPFADEVVTKRILFRGSRWGLEHHSPAI